MRNERNAPFRFTFGGLPCDVTVRGPLPRLEDLVGPGEIDRVLLVCDGNTEALALKIGGPQAKRVILPPGEAAKGWPAVEKVAQAALEAGLGRDGLLVGVGGGVVTDLTAFAASVYMRGTRLVLVPTTLLGMADAALGGKTGFDLFGIKNLIGTFRPAESVFMAVDALETLPEGEYRSGLAEVVKTAILGDEELFELLEGGAGLRRGGGAADTEIQMVSRCVSVKGRIVESDPTETGTERALLNLGHTYGHALEAVAGLGVLTHGEAVAWGIGRACCLGKLLGSVGERRRTRILTLLARFGYETAPIHPAALSAAEGDAGRAVDFLVSAMSHDKKKKDGKLRFIVPTDSRAHMVDASSAVIEESFKQ